MPAIEPLPPPWAKPGGHEPGSADEPAPLLPAAGIATGSGGEREPPRPVAVWLSGTTVTAGVCRLFGLNPRDGERTGQ